MLLCLIKLCEFDLFPKLVDWHLHNKGMWQMSTLTRRAGDALDGPRWVMLMLPHQAVPEGSLDTAVQQHSLRLTTNEQRP